MTASIKQFKLVHLSDPHLTSLENIRWYELLNKRILGYLSWRLRRRHVHLPEILARLQSDFSSLKPDHIIISGDLTHIGTENECKQALSWLTRLSAPEHATVIPGNHDRYAPSNWQRTLGLWQDYMAGDQNESSSTNQPIFPTLRRRGSIALIGLSTALPTLPFLASGRLGRAQLQALEKLLVRLKQENLFRIVVLHHGPVADTTNRRRGLDDAKELRRILYNYGAELILHGHGHKFFHGAIECKGSSIPVFGVPSASAISKNPEKYAGYNIYQIEKLEDSWYLNVCSRVQKEETTTFEVKKEYEFKLRQR